MNKLDVSDCFGFASGRRLLVWAALLLVGMTVSQPVQASSSVQLSWSASTNASAKGYMLYYGPSSRTYTNAVNVGTNTTATITNLLSGTNYFFAVTAYNSLTNQSGFSPEAVAITPPISFFAGQQYVSNNVTYLQFPNGVVFGYYSLANFPYIYHQDLGLVYYSDSGDGKGGIYLKDSTTGVTWYTSPAVWPQMYDMTLKAWLYYYPSTTNPGHYTSAPRTFKNMTTGKNITR